MEEIEISRHSLPEEIVEEEILSRLPVKSLLRFRCVSRSWRLSIDSKRFTQNHLHKSANNKSLPHHRIILTYKARRDHVRLSSLLSAFPTHPNFQSQSQCNNFNFPTDIPVPCYGIRIIGCCNGLVCILLKGLESRHNFMLWNPSTRIWRIIDNAPRRTMHYGFGWDEPSGEYKVIAVDKEYYNVYSSKTESWKKIKGPELSDKTHVYRSKRGMLAGGKLHWGSKDSYDIVAFDLRSEATEMVGPPPFPEGGGWGGQFLVVVGLLGEFLSVHCYFDRSADVWVMKEQCRWEKVIVAIDDSSLWISPSLDRFCGDFLLIKTWKIMNCDHKNNKVDAIEDADHADGCDVYVESLVSP